MSGGGAHRLRRRVGRERAAGTPPGGPFPGSRSREAGRGPAAALSGGIPTPVRAGGPPACSYRAFGAVRARGGRGIRPAAFRSRGGGMSWPWPARESAVAGRPVCGSAARGGRPRSAVRAGPFAGRGNVRARGGRPCRPWEAAGRAVLRAYRFSSRDDAGQGPCRRRIPVRGPVRALGRDFSRMRGPATAGEGADGARCRGAAVRPISGVAVLVLPSWMPVPAVVPSGTWRARTRSAGAAARRRRRIPRAPTEALMAPVVSSLSLSVVPSSVSGVRAGRITAVERLFLHVGAARKRLRTATVARAFGQVGRRLSGSKQGA